MNILFQINGGIGKNVAATAVCEGLKKKYPNSKLIVVSGYPEVFVNNPFVEKCFNFHQTTYFYKEYLENQEFEVFCHDPYLTTSHLKQNTHLIMSWFELFGLTYDNEQPRLYLTDREMNFYRSKIVSDKPLLIMQTNGGADGQSLKYSWARDIPYHIGAKVVEEFAPTHNILHIRRDDQPAYNNTAQLKDDFRVVASILPLAQIRLFMDSFAQHTAYAMGCKSTVLWVANKPQVFGYAVNDNILANPFTVSPDLRHSYLAKFDISGNPLEFPYNNEGEIFDIDRVISSLKAQLDGVAQQPQLQQSVVEEVKVEEVKVEVESVQ
jgi:hypothetical protein